MAHSLAAYVADARGRYIDVDGVYGAQCWDQWSHYAQWLGVPAINTYTWYGGAQPHTGWACNVYHNAARAGLGQWFEILPASATPRAGDVAFWELGSAWFPLSHVATVLSVPRPGMLRCLTQNPGAVQIADLVTRGIIGYLRPKGLTVTGVDATKSAHLTASQKQARRKKKNMLMAFSRHAKSDKTPRWYVYGPGFWLVLTDQVSANAHASQLGIGVVPEYGEAAIAKFRTAALGVSAARK